MHADCRAKDDAVHTEGKKGGQVCNLSVEGDGRGDALLHQAQHVGTRVGLGVQVEPRKK